MAELAGVGRSADVAVLVHGDPSVSDWGFIERIKRMARDRGVGVETIPGVSSLNVFLAGLLMVLFLVMVVGSLFHWVCFLAMPLMIPEFRLPMGLCGWIRH